MWHFGTRIIRNPSVDRESLAFEIFQDCNVGLMATMVQLLKRAHAATNLTWPTPTSWITCRAVLALCGAQPFNQAKAKLIHAQYIINCIYVCVV